MMTRMRAFYVVYMIFIGWAIYLAGRKTQAEIDSEYERRLEELCEIDNDFQFQFEFNTN